MTDSTTTPARTAIPADATRAAVDLELAQHGEGHPFLLLHGGAGPQSVASFAAALADRQHAHVLVPTHPGFAGTPRPEELDSVPALATLYRDLLDLLDLTDVTVIGNSVGGWVAVELALLHSPRVSSLVLVDAVGIEVPGEPVADAFAMTPAQIADHSYADPDRFRIDPAALSDAQRIGMTANMATLRTYAGTMTDPGLRARLADLDVPTLVVWGEADRIVTPEYGRAYAAAVPGARFELLPAAGHLPQVETPDPLVQLTWTFADDHTTNQPQARA